MYDVTTGDKASKAVGAVRAFFVLAALSSFFMMWWGHGGHSAIAPAGLQSLFVQIPIYLFVEFVVVHGVFFVATRTTRKEALYGFLSPREVLQILLVPVLTYTLLCLLNRLVTIEKAHNTLLAADAQQQVAGGAACCVRHRANVAPFRLMLVYTLLKKGVAIFFFSSKSQTFVSP